MSNSNALKVSIRFEDEKFRFKYESEVEAGTDNTDDSNLLSLWDEILSEVFSVEPEKESIEYLEGSSIYNLDSEQDILNREANDHFLLNEGMPDVEEVEFDMLIDIAEEYFSRPSSYYLDEEHAALETVKGFVQIYHSEAIGSTGKISVKWRSTNASIQVYLEDLNFPERIISYVESLGFVWSPVIRICFYGESLNRVVGERIYLPNESKELVPLSEEFGNILLAVPASNGDYEHDESLFDFIEHQMNENVLYGNFPEFGKQAMAHWQYTHARLLELELEAAEEKNLLLIQLKERRLVAKKNHFTTEHSSAIKLIQGLNSKSLTLKFVLSQDLHLLRQVLRLTENGTFRINNSIDYLQINAFVKKSHRATLVTQQSQTIELINKINKGEFVEFHLLNMNQLEDIFAILWSNTGFRIDSSKKDIYFLLKNNLLRMRAKKARSSRN